MSQSDIQLKKKTRDFVTKNNDYSLNGCQETQIKIDPEASTSPII